MPERTPEQVEEHYQIEIKLADRLRNSSIHEREGENLYVTVYDELYNSVPHHPQLLRKTSKEQTEHSVGWQMGILKQFLSPSDTFVEIGAGDCTVSFECAKYVKNVIAIDVSKAVSATDTQPDNFEFIQTNGVHIPLDPESVDLVYSNQVIEHLHPDDAKDQLITIYKALKKGGLAIFITPNKAGGPWDISCLNDEEARGLHLKEYTLKDLAELFSSVGFRKIKAYVGARGSYIRFPMSPLILIESVLLKLPFKLRLKIARFSVFRALLGVKLVAEK